MDTEKRLEKLERELFAEKRRNRWLLAAVGLGLVGVGLAWTLATTTATAQGASIGPKVIRANQFILEDETGTTRAALQVGKGGSGLSLYDENGKLRAMVGVVKDGPGLTLFDENGKRRVMLGEYKNGPILGLFDENGKGRVSLDVTKNGPGLELFDENGKVIRSKP